MANEHGGHPDPRYCAMYAGVVVDNRDPERLGRVRVRIPGLVETQTGWALPMGMPGSGAAQRGFWDVPDVGAEVCIWFQGGDVDHPYFLAGNWGRGEQPASIAATEGTTEPTQVKAYETARWAITFDERPGKELLQIRDKKSGDAIEIDGVAFGIQIKGSAAVNIEATGPVSISGLQVTLNGRQVLPGKAPI